MTPEDAARRQRLAPGTPAGIDEAMIHRLVHAFYAKVRRDAVLGPIFDAAIGDRWDEHLARLCDFWSSVMLMTGRFKGTPMSAHMALPDIRRGHFARWLRLFQQTAEETCPPEAAALFRAKSEIIAQSLLMGVESRRRP